MQIIPTRIRVFWYADYTYNVRVYACTHVRRLYIPSGVYRNRTLAVPTVYRNCTAYVPKLHTVKPRIVAGSRIQAGPRIQAGGSSELYQ